MKLRSRFISCVTSLLLTLSAVTAAAATRVVDDDGEATASNCDSSTDTPYTTVNAALADAGVGDKIIVCPGVYAEQIVVNKALSITGRGLAILRPVGMVQNATSVSPSATPIAAVVLVTAPTGTVLIEQMTIDGSNNGITACTPSVMGIYFQNASGSVKNAVVRNTYQSTGIGSGFEGCQSGLGIFVQSSTSASNVLVSGTSVHDYQKNGITGNETDTVLTATNNTVTGWGGTTALAQNGIQIGFGAGGSVKENRVIDNLWTPCATVDDPDCLNGSASGILIFDAADGVEVTGNTVGTSQVGVYFDVDNGLVSANNIQNTLVYDGIFVDGDLNDVLRNLVVDSDESGIWISGDSNLVQRNTINEAPIGIVDDGATNTITLTGSGRNTFYNVGTNVDTPAAATAALASSVPAGRANVKPAR